MLASSRTSDGETSCRQFIGKNCSRIEVKYMDSRLSNMKFLYLGSSMFMLYIDLYQTNTILYLPLEPRFSFRCHMLIMPSIPPLPCVSVPKPLNPQYHLLTCQSSLSPRPRSQRPQEQVAFPPLKVDCSRPVAVPPLLHSAKGPLTIEVAAYTMAQGVPVTTSMTEKAYAESQAVESGVDFPGEGIWRAGAVERDL